MAEWLFDYLPESEIVEALNCSDGSEIASGKIASPESSAALAVNTFGIFLNNPELLPRMPGTDALVWPAIAVAIEQQVRFPWSGGRHPWLDAFIETQTHIIGIESKRYEPFRTKAAPSFQEAYCRPVWGDRMQRFL